MVATGFLGRDEPSRKTIYDVNVTPSNLDSKFFAQNGLDRCSLKPVHFTSDNECRNKLRQQSPLVEGFHLTILHMAA